MYNIIGLQIEEQLLFGSSDAQQPGAQRRRPSSGGGRRRISGHAGADPAAWSALAELYAQLGQDNMMHHICSAHVVK